MSHSGVSPSEMRRLRDISDSELDAMRDGQNTPEDDGVARFVRDLSEAFPVTSAAEFEAAHLSAVMQAVRLQADNGSPETESASADPRTESRGRWSTQSGRTAMIKTLLASKGAKVAAGVTAALLAFTGVAVAGVLPQPAQNAVANAAHVVGLDLPGGTDEIVEPEAVAPVFPEATVEATMPPAVSDDESADDDEATEKTAKSASDDDQDDQGEDSDDQGEDADDQGEAADDQDDQGEDSDDQGEAADDQDDQGEDADDQDEAAGDQDEDADDQGEAADDQDDDSDDQGEDADDQDDQGGDSDDQDDNEQ